MAGFNPVGNAQRYFFDRQKVLTKAEKAKDAALKKYGAFVRRRARSSLRKRKKASPPGKPPSLRKESLKLIFFLKDPDTGGVLVGPVGFGWKGKPVPGVHERGARVAGKRRVIEVKRKAGRDARGKFVRGGTERRVLTGARTYPKRPFMGPAEEAERPKFLALFKDRVK